MTSNEVRELELLRSVADAAAAVCSEPAVREELMAYVMGVTLLARLDTWRYRT